jgi:hypothetical protein
VNTPAYDYDIAVSFLARDEPLALQIRDALAPLKVFVYSKAQEEVAGTDGVAAFRDVFRHRARVSLVLFRPGWGESKWTRVEETAIRDHCLDANWEHLMFVRLERADAIPKWVPDSYVYLDFQTFGIPDLIGAIKTKLARLGVELRAPTAAERAATLAAREAFDRETERLLMSSARIFLDAAAALFAELDQQIAEIQASSGWRIVHGHDEHGQFVAFLDRVSMQLLPKELYINSSRSAYFCLRHFDGRLLTPQEIGRRMMLLDPQEVARDRVDLAREPGIEWAWRFRGRLLPHSELARELLTDFLERRTQAMRRNG